MTEDYTKLNYVTSIRNKNSISQVEDNLKHFLDWSFLQIDGYVNVNKLSPSQSGLYTLKPQPQVTGTSVGSQTKAWEGPVKDWIYENTSQLDPAKNISHISGVFLNNTFLPAPTGSGNYGYYIDYPLGKIVFNNAINSNSNLKLDYAYRYIQVYKSNEAIWWKELSDIIYTSKDNSPYSTLLSSHKVQLPFLIIEPVARTNQEAYELGNAKNMISQDILLHVFTENTTQRSIITDILLSQKDKSLILYDVNKVVKNAVYPLNYRGEKNINGLTYSQLVTNPNYQHQTSYIKSADLAELNNFTSSLYNGIVRWTVKIFP
jgi:hypothetical protein